MSYIKKSTKIKKLRDKLEVKKRQKASLLQQASQYKKTHGSEFFNPLQYQKLLLNYM